MKTKTCNRCKQEKDISNFTTNGKKSHKPYCKPCGKVIFKANYEAAIVEHFGGLKCETCGFEGNLVQYDCHHFLPSTKAFRISRNIGMATNSKKRFKAELDKCVLLCVNCHRLEHTTYRG